MRIELWKDIKGQEGRYKVSDLGNVVSTINYRGTGDVFMKKLNVGGYLGVKICDVMKVKTIKIHRLVAESFIPNPENKEQVNHINGIKTDNRVENLEWCTRSENQLHAYKMGLQVRAVGEMRGKVCKLNGAQVKEIRIKINNGCKAVDLVREYNVSEATISSIKTRATWKEV